MPFPEGAIVEVDLTETVRIRVRNVTQAELDIIKELILAIDVVVAEESGWWKRQNDEPVFIAVIRSPRRLEGHDRNLLRAKIVAAVPGAAVKVW